MNKQEIFNRLSNIKDPISGNNIIAEAFLKVLEIEGIKVILQLELTPAHSTVHQNDLKQQIISELQQISEDFIFDIQFSTKQVAPPKKENPLPNVKNIIAIASGKGGVGKSTVTSNLAVSLAKKGYKVGILDADVYGPSMPTMFGVEEKKPMVQQIEGKNYIVPIEKYGVKIISMGFLADATQAIIWRGSMVTKVIRQFISDCDWDELDFLLLDLPPGTGDIHLTMVQNLPITGAIIVTTPQKVALADAQRGLAMFQQENINVPVLGIVENMSYFTPKELPNNKYFIFGENGGKDFAQKNGVELLGQIPIVQSIRENGDQGKPEVIFENIITKDAFNYLTDRIVETLKERNSKNEPTKIVEITRR